MSKQIHLERLIGVTVRDSAGASAGPIEEVIAVESGDTWLVSEFLTGPVRGFARLAELEIALWLLGLLGAAKCPTRGYRIPWEQLDLTEPGKPLLRCPVASLARLP